MRYTRQLLLAVLSILVFGGQVSVDAVQNKGIRSEIIRIKSPIPGLQLALHHRFRKSPRSIRQPIVLFAEGSAVPTAGNAAFQINGVSWMDNLAANGFDVWSLDYLGYGESSRYRETDLRNFPGRAKDCASQLANAVTFILAKRGAAKLSIIGDSFGSLVAGVYATRSPKSMEKLILFAPVTPVAEPKPNQALSSNPPFHLVTPNDLWQLYSSWLPNGEYVGVNRDFFLKFWGSKYLDTDSMSRQRTPPSVMVPAGPDLDTADIERGEFPYDPKLIEMPTLIIFAEWDSVATEEGGKRLFDLISGARDKRRIVIGKGTHVLQLESSRHILYAEVVNFLRRN